MIETISAQLTFDAHVAAIFKISFLSYIRNIAQTLP